MSTTEQVNFAEPIGRVQICGRTGSQVATLVTTNGPTLLQPFRDSNSVTSGVGEMRLGAQPESQPSPGNVTKLYPPAWGKANLWLPFADTWKVTMASEAEDGVSVIDFEIPFMTLLDPDLPTLQVVMHGLGLTIPSPHAEVVDTTWNQVMKMEQNMVSGPEIWLSTRGGPIRYRWGGPPPIAGGSGYFELAPGVREVFRNPPLASLWVRAEAVGQPVTTISLLSQRMR